MFFVVFLSATTSTARKNIQVQLTYSKITLNHCIATKETLNILMRQAMEKIHSLFSQNVCANVNCTDVDVAIDCGSASGLTVVTVKINLPSTL